MSASPILRTDAGHAFLDQSAEALALLMGILAVIHPSQYRLSREIKHWAMQDTPSCAEGLDKWGSVFTAATIIANRQTPFHRDLGGRPEFYDLLTSVGPYPAAPMYLRPIGVKASNVPGTVCAFSGFALGHAVRRIPFSRLSLALYLRDNVREGANRGAPEWMNQRVYEEFIGPSRGKLRKAPNSAAGLTTS